MKDHVQDTSGKILYQVNSEVPLPQLVKEASVISSSAVPGMSNQMFADTANKSFPICSYADTWLSAAYFQKQAGQDNAVEGRLRDACELWSIDYSATKAMPKEASCPVAGKIDCTDDAGAVVYTAAIHSVDDLQKLASDVIKQPLKYTYAMRNSLAKGILKYAKDGQLSNRNICSLQKSAGYGVGSVQGVSRAIDLRYAALPKNNFDEIRSKLLSFKEAAAKESVQGVIPAAFCEKLASALSVLDSNIDTERLGSKYASPESDIFGLSIHAYNMYNDSLVKLANGGVLVTSNLDYRDMGDFLSVAFGKEAKTEEEIENTLKGLASTEADMVMHYTQKKAVDEGETNDMLPTQEELEDGEKSELPSEAGLDWPTDESAPREDDNED